MHAAARVHKREECRVHGGVEQCTGTCTGVKSSRRAERGKAAYWHVHVCEEVTQSGERKAAYRHVHGRDKFTQGREREAGSSILACAEA